LPRARLSAMSYPMARRPPKQPTWRSLSWAPASQQEAKPSVSPQSSWAGYPALAPRCRHTDSRNGQRSPSQSRTGQTGVVRCTSAAADIHEVVAVYRLTPTRRAGSMRCWSCRTMTSGRRRLRPRRPRQPCRPEGKRTRGGRRPQQRMRESRTPPSRSASGDSALGRRTPVSAGLRMLAQQQSPRS